MLDQERAIRVTLDNLKIRDRLAAINQITGHFDLFGRRKLSATPAKIVNSAGNGCRARWIWRRRRQVHRRPHRAQQRVIDHWQFRPESLCALSGRYPVVEIVPFQRAQYPSDLAYI